MVAAYDVLRMHGPAGLSLRSIAARLGVSEPGLMKRIGSKSELVARLQLWATEQTRALIVQLDTREPIDGLRWLFRLHARQVTSPSSLAHLLAFSAMCVATPALRAHAAERQELLVSAVATALRRAKRPHVVSTARVLVALLDGVSLAWVVQPRGSLEQALLEAVNLVLDGGKSS